MTLRAVLQSPEAHSWRYAVYLPRNQDWELDSPAVILDPGYVEADPKDPPEASERNLRYALGIAEVRDAIANLLQQKAAATDTDRLRAFLYYVTNDAFIRL